MVVSAIAFAGTPVPATSRQLLLVVVADPDDSAAVLTRAHRAPGGPWVVDGAPLPARVGLNGVAWGIGLHDPQPGLQKVEGDLRTPEGVFLVGAAYRDDTVEELAVAWPVIRVGERDLWVEDPASPAYNAHLVVPPGRPLEPWEERARMRLGDPYLRLKVFVEHNAPTPGHPARPGAGSAIFLHAGAPEGDVATAGCVAIDPAALREVIGWLEPGATPVLAVLTRDDLRGRASWGLPADPPAGHPAGTPP